MSEARKGKRAGNEDIISGTERGRFKLWSRVERGPFKLGPIPKQENIAVRGRELFPLLNLGRGLCGARSK